LKLKFFFSASLIFFVTWMFYNKYKLRYLNSKLYCIYKKYISRQMQFELFAESRPTNKRQRSQLDRYEIARDNQFGIWLIDFKIRADIYRRALGMCNVSFYSFTFLLRCVPWIFAEALLRRIFIVQFVIV